MLKEGRCDECGKPYTSVRPTTRYCSRICGQRVHGDLSARNAYWLGLPSERIPKFLIFERDNWTCYLCGGTTLREIGGYDPLSPTRDHVIPFSDPACPGHLATNVRTTHRVCNLSKNKYCHTEFDMRRRSRSGPLYPPASGDVA